MRRAGAGTLWTQKSRLLYSQSRGNPSFRVFGFEKMDYRQDFTQRLYAYPREVLSCVLNPDLICNETINPDARKRARLILDTIISAGCYSQSAGFAFIRKSICEHIARVDCVPEPAISSIILTDGISQGLHLIVRSIISKPNDAIMVPTPCYPFYAASISQNQGQIVSYRLGREDGWQIDEQELEDQYQLSRKSGNCIKAIIINNPSNPTGSTFTEKSLRLLLDFAVKHRLLVIADEAYSDPLRPATSSFVSCRKLLETQNSEIRDNCELVSLYSMSKGLLMQGGYRAGYLSFHNINPEVFKQLSKFQTFYGCSGVMGQLLIELIINPFFCASQTTKSSLLAEHLSLLDQLKSNAKLVREALSGMTNVKCKLDDQAIYAYPQVTFSKKALQAAKRKGTNIDAYYCEQMLKNTGTALIPGSYFSQSSASYHFRLSPMILPSKKLEMFLSRLKQSNENFHRKAQH